MKLLTMSNPKLQKGAKYGYLSAGLHLAPSDLSGVMNTCPYATPGCRAACLNKAGRGGIGAHNAIQDCRMARTWLFHYARQEFMADLQADVRLLVRQAAALNLKPAVRLNCTSDIRWETVRINPPGQGHSHFVHANIMDAFPSVQWYDYTKAPAKLRQNLPANYHLTYSHHELTADDDMRQWLRTAPVAVVFDTRKGQPLPETWDGLPVVDGDLHDLTFLAPAGTIVGLRAKGPAIGDRSGFVVPA